MILFVSLSGKYLKRNRVRDVERWGVKRGFWFSWLASLCVASSAERLRWSVALHTFTDNLTRKCLFSNSLFLTIQKSIIFPLFRRRHSRVRFSRVTMNSEFRSFVDKISIRFQFDWRFEGKYFTIGWNTKYTRCAYARTVVFFLENISSEIMKFFTYRGASHSGLKVCKGCFWRNTYEVTFVIRFSFSGVYFVVYNSSR